MVYKTKNFSETEKETILTFLFTKPHADYGFMYPQELISGEEISPLMSAVSRTHMGLQDRVLKFLDENKVEQTRAMLPLMVPLIEIFRNPDGSLKVAPKAAYFNKEWVLAHGHNSIKEGADLLGYSENHSDITGKHITGHPLSRPQVKSTRYLSYGKVLDMSLADEDLNSLKCADEALTTLEYLKNKYLDFTERLTEHVYHHPDTTKIIDFLRRDDITDSEVWKSVERKRSTNPEFKPDEKFLNEEREKYINSLSDPKEIKKQLEKFVIDYSRMYLTASTRTSLVFSTDVRTFESIITSMVSSPRLEDKKRGHELWEESRKIMPILLGSNSHIGVDTWKSKNEYELRSYIEDKLARINDLPNRDERKPTAKILLPQDIEMYTDRFNAALVVFQYSDAALENIISELTYAEVKQILELAHKYRGEHDIIHPAIAHGGLIVELLMGYGGYRDLFRHRKGARTTQLLTTRHGFEVPEIFNVFDMQAEYLDDMARVHAVYEKARAEDRYKAEKLVPFGALVRAMHSWQVDEIGYIGGLRSTFTSANLSYMYIVRDMLRQISEKMPETGRYLKYDTHDYPAHIWKNGIQFYDAIMRK